MRNHCLILTALSILFLLTAQRADCQETTLGPSESLKATIPSLPIVPLRSSLSCEALLDSFVGPEKDWVEVGPGDQIKAETKKGTDKFAVEIKENAVSILSRVNFEAGFLEAPNYTILQNDAGSLVAYWVNNSPASLETFILNKRTGLAIWTKAKPLDMFGRDIPEARSLYFACK